eukprot:scaffold129312_cov17-Prasinocladus_malaysianus.AAC.1
MHFSHDLAGVVTMRLPSVDTLINRSEVGRWLSTAGERNLSTQLRNTHQKIGYNGCIPGGCRAALAGPLSRLILLEFNEAEH